MWSGAADIVNYNPYVCFEGQSTRAQPRPTVAVLQRQHPADNHNDHNADDDHDHDDNADDDLDDADNDDADTFAVRPSDRRRRRQLRLDHELYTNGGFDSDDQSHGPAHHRRQRIRKRDVVGVQRLLRPELGAVQEHHLPDDRQPRVPHVRRRRVLRLLRDARTVGVLLVRPGLVAPHRDRRDRGHLPFRRFGGGAVVEERPRIALEQMAACVLARAALVGGVGSRHDSSSAALWDDLYAAHADVILNGHDHDYQRYGLLNPSGATDPNGIREFIVGTGGSGHYNFTSTSPMPGSRTPRITAS